MLLHEETASAYTSLFRRSEPKSCRGRRIHHPACPGTAQHELCRCPLSAVMGSAAEAAVSGILRSTYRYKGTIHRKVFQVMAIKTQCDIILNHIQTHGSITDMEAYQMYGICRLSGRIFDLRQRGYDIQTNFVKSKNRLGKKIQYGVYSFAH